MSLFLPGPRERDGPDVMLAKARSAARRRSEKLPPVRRALATYVRVAWAIFFSQPLSERELEDTEMPALVVLGRRSKMAGDDLAIVCIVTATIRLLEFVFLIPAAALTFEEYLDNSPNASACIGNRSGKNRAGIIPIPYLALSLFFASLSMVLSFLMHKMSGRGSPTQPELRKGLGRLFACQLFVMPLLLLILAAAGTSGIVYLHERVQCVGYLGTKPKWFKYLIAAISCQYFEVCVYTIVVIAWLRFELRRRIIPRKPNAPKTIEEKAEEWNECCQCCCGATALCCCFSFGGRGIRDEDFSSMARTLAELFDDGGALDVVASDIVAGLMAMSLEQEDEKRRCMEQLKKDIKDPQEAEGIGGLDEATTSRAVVLTEQLKALLRITTGDVEAGNIILGQGVPSFLLGSNGGGSRAGDPKADTREDAIMYTTNEEGHIKLAVSQFLSPDIDTDCYAVAQGSYFLRYSIAVNTWKNYVFMNLTTNCCRLAFARCYELPKYRRKREDKDCYYEPVVIGENALGLHEAALLKVAGFDLEKVELCYAHFDNTVEKATYCILVDHVWKSVILCIRGSLSLEDYVVNLDLDPEELGMIGAEYGFDGHGEYCHKGYLSRAKWICEDLKRHKVLEDLLDKDKGRYKDYTLRVQGHSLGAGTAAPVALMLRNKYPDLQCICYAPPGGLFSRGLAIRCKEIVTTYVLSTDLVPRISARTVRQLRDKLLQTVSRIKVPKRQLVQIHRSAQKVNELPCGINDILYDASEVPESEFKFQLDRFQKLQEDRDAEKKEEATITLHPPGRFVHLVKTKSKDEGRILLQGRFMMDDIFNCFTCDRFAPEEEFAPRWADMSDFDTIVVSSTLVSDHMVEVNEYALGQVSKAFGIDPSRPPS